MLKTSILFFFIPAWQLLTFWWLFLWCLLGRWKRWIFDHICLGWWNDAWLTLHLHQSSLLNESEWVSQSVSDKHSQTVTTSFELPSSHARVTSIKFTKRESVSELVSQWLTWTKLNLIDVTLACEDGNSKLVLTVWLCLSLTGLTDWLTHWLV